MWWPTEKADKVSQQSLSDCDFHDEDFAKGFATRIFATLCNLAPRCYCRGNRVTNSGHCPTTITADFALGKTVS